MRKALPILALAAAAVAALPSRPAAAEVTRTVKLSQDATRPFAVENLAGTMRIMAGTGTQAEVTATLHAESAALLDGMNLAPATDDKGRPSLRVGYPESERRFRYPQGGGNTETKYAGRRVKVSRDSGVVAYADLEVRLPKDVAEAWLRQAVGPLQASGVSGTLRFDTGSGDITVSDVSGDVLADTGSGDVRVSKARGRLKCDTGSGDCEITGFKGELLGLDTGSGNLQITDVEVSRLRADTGSGDVRVTRATVEDVSADTGSGSVELDLLGSGLTRVKADTGSGDVRIGLPADATFELRADMGSGDLESGFSDAQAIVNGRQVVGYRRADGRIKIDVDSGSGDVTVRPSR